MALRFTVLASGSGGNASLVEADGFGLLLDAGLGPRQLADRLAAAGTSWQGVQALLLTHAHSDHWNEATFAHLLRRRLPLYCHADHHRPLQTYSPSFAALRGAGLVRAYEPGQELVPAAGLRCRPFALCHDGGATFGFRIEGAPDLFGHAPALAYAADLGCWDDALAGALADVDLLALEFNHDVAMEYRSGRHPRLIARVLGDEGHLSNEQAAGLLRRALGRSQPGRLRYLVQLHLSRDCNAPALAADRARQVLHESNAAAEVHTASQHRPTRTFALNGEGNGRRPRPRARKQDRTPAGGRAQPWLPGWE